MNHEPESDPSNQVARDGLAAVAIVVLAAVLIAVVINHFV